MSAMERDPLDSFGEVDAALRELELEPVPPALSRAVLEKVRALRPLPLFRLRWIDYALGAFSAGMLGIVFFVSMALPPFFRVSLTNEIVYWFNRFLLTPTPFVLGLVALGTAGLAITVGLFGLLRALPAPRSVPEG